jgi:hypothetical protein
VAFDEGANRTQTLRRAAKGALPGDRATLSAVPANATNADYTGARGRLSVRRPARVARSRRSNVEQWTLGDFMPIIESIAVTTARVPLERVTSFATGTVAARKYGLVKLRSTEGIEGIGFCCAGYSGGTLVVEPVEKLLAPVLLKRNSLLVEGLWQRMFRESLLQGRAGFVMRAISILDCALWDLNARSVQLPLYNYLGAFVDDAVPADASGGYYQDGKTPKNLGEEMASYVEGGLSRRQDENRAPVTQQE